MPFSAGGGMMGIYYRLRRGYVVHGKPALAGEHADGGGRDVFAGKHSLMGGTNLRGLEAT
jgi:hypothetical protein